MSLLISYLMILVVTLLSVAWYTLLERKVLGYSQVRKGPNLVSLQGFLQPLADAPKLILKEISSPVNSRNLYSVAPVTAFCLSLLMCSGVVAFSHLWTFSYSILFILLVSSLSVYSIMGSGFFSSSPYAIVGAMRMLAQVVSYEVSLITAILIFCYTHKSVNLVSFFKSQFLLAFLIVFLWLIIILGETGRAPLDFIEGESEIISGYNIEFSGAHFTLLFLAEYTMIIFFSLLTGYIFLNSGVFWLMGLFFSCIILLTRATYCRLRYNQLMSLNWKSIMPVLLLTLMSISI